MDNTEKQGRIYRMLWRWHFYAGILLLPFIIILSLSGMVYLFKPQIERAIDAPYHNLAIAGEIAPASAQVAAALKTMPDAQLRHYEMPEFKNDAPRIFIFSKGEEHIVYIHPVTLEVLKKVPKEGRFMAIARNIHGELLIGKTGSYIVEAAACWAIIMIVTGLYLWWPRNAKGLGGILTIRSGRLFWRDLHSVTGIYVSFFAIFLLITGLPWTDVWGDAFKEVRKITHTMPERQDWTINRKEEKQFLMEEMGHSHHNAPFYAANIDDMVAHAKLENLAYPAEIAPPNKKTPNWVIRSNAQNRIKRIVIEYNPQNAQEVKRVPFEKRHIIDKVIGVGVAAHEGQLFGWFNQFLGVLTALALCAMSISAFVMWRKRAPNGVLGAPPLIKDQKIGLGIAILIIIFAILLPVLGISLIIIGLLEFLILKRIKPVSNWLGIA
jgi:uncharacterized iron-regulated membrane protein